MFAAGAAIPCLPVFFAAFVDQTVKFIAPQQSTTVNENIGQRQASGSAQNALPEHRPKNI
jgi:hypothetical protein